MRSSPHALLRAGLIVSLASSPGCQAGSNGSGTEPGVALVGWLVLTPDSVVLADGDTAVVSVTAFDPGGRTIDLQTLALVWSVEPPEIAEARDQLLVGTRPGTGTVRVSAGAATASAPLEVFGVPERIDPVSSVVAGGSPSSALADPVTVQVLDRHGAPLPGVDVWFEATDSGAHALPDSTTTGPDGRAATVWTLGPASGTQRLLARVEALDSIEFSAVAVPDLGALERLSGDGQPGVVGLPLPDSLRVRLVDIYGDPVAGIPVLWATDDSLGALSATSTLTDSAGATAVDWTLGTAPGTYRTTARIGALEALFTTVAAAGDPARVVIAPDSASVPGGDSLQFVADAFDAFDNPVVGPTLDWLTRNPSDSTGGTIDEEGRYRAGYVPGLFRIVVAAGDAADTSTVVVLENGTPNLPPSAAFTHSCGDLLCTFDATGSADPEGGALSYAWTFGDGATGSASVETHAYPAIGTYTATLTVTDDVGAEATASQVVDVNPQGPSTWLYPGMDLQAAVDGHPQGTAFTIKAGTHRLQSIVARAGDTFTGEPGAVLSGARILEGFAFNGGYWVIDGQTDEAPPDAYSGQSHCQDSAPLCERPETLFLDGQRFTQVGSLAEMGPGRWFFDYGQDRIYLVDNPGGATVELAVTPFAIYGDATDGLTVQGLVIEKYANPSQKAALKAIHSDNVVFRDNEVRYNHGIGVSISRGDGGEISNNSIHHQGQLGVSGFDSRTLLIQGNTISDNNQAGYNPFWEAGGVKLVGALDPTIRSNQVSRNEGHGIWTDIDTDGALINRNTVTDNLRAGIVVEISRNTSVRNNTLRANGGGAPSGWGSILLSNSENVDVVENEVIDSNGAVLVWQTTRGSGPWGPYVSKNIQITGNTFNVPTGFVGVRQNEGNGYNMAAAGIVFDDNAYTLGAEERYFIWLEQPAIDEAAWQALGQDVNSSFVRP